jgi:hypothetical protein
VVTAFTLRGAAALVVPAGCRSGAAGAGPAAAGRRGRAGSFPPVELLTGRLDVFHATNFVLPPLRRAARRRDRPRPGLPAPDRRR